MSANKIFKNIFSKAKTVGYEYILFGLAIIFITALTSLFPIDNYDIWWHLKTGEYIVTENSIPDSDIYSFTAQGNPWITHEWLAELIFYALYLAGGFDLLIIFKVIMAVIIAILLISNIFSRDKINPLIFILLAAAVCIGSFRLFVRPHLFTYLFLTIFSIAIFTRRYFERRKIITLLAVPLLFLFWANIHSGFMIGLGIYWIVAIGTALETRFKESDTRQSTKESLKKFILPPAVASIAALVNPNGIKAFIYPFQLASDPVLKNAIAELISPFEIFSTERLYWLLLIVILGFAIYGLILNLKKRPTISLILLIGIISSLTSIRNSYEFSILTAAALTVTMGATPRRYFWPALLATLIFVFSCGFYTSRYINTTRGMKLGISGDYPQGAADFLKGIEYGGNIYAPLGWGSYLIWSGLPETKVFIDGRLLVYGSDLFNEYHYIRQNEPGALEKLAGFGTDAVMVPIGRERWPIREAVAISPDWQLCYFNDQSVVFLMKNNHNLEWLKKYGFNKIDPLAPGYLRNDARRADTAVIVREALRAYEQAPGEVTTSAVLARAYYLNANFSSAAEYYKKAVTAAPMMTDFLYQVATSFHRGGEFDSAAVWYDKAIAAMPTHEQSYYEYGAMEAGRGNYQKAIEIWKSVLVINPQGQAAGFIEQVEKMMDGAESDSG